MDKSYHNTTTKANNYQAKSDFIPNLDNFKESAPSQKSNLTKADFADLAESFISPGLAEMAKSFRADNDAVCRLMNRKIRLDKDQSGIVFPYFLAGDNKNPRIYRVKLDEPDRDANGKITAKYLSAYGAHNKFYFPPLLTDEMLKDAALPVVACEGEKKALSLLRVATRDFTQSPSFIPLGIAGVWNWKDEVNNPDTGEKYKRPFADFGLLTWQNRKAVILFDADTASNPQVLAAQKALGETLKSMLADAHVCTMPMIAGAKGIDDLLFYWQTEHDTETAVQNCFELLGTAKRFEPNKFNLINDLSISYEKSERRNTTIKVSRDNQILQVDTFILEKAKDRNSFIESLDLFDDEQTQVDEILKFITTLPVDQKETEGKSDETIQTSFQVLKDGRVIEQIRNGFAVYDSNTNEHCVLENVTDSDGVKYEPIADELFQKPGGIQLANELVEYGTEKQLINEIERYLSSYLDLKPLFLKLTALYILFTYVFDSVLELSYLNATGDAGSGKSRFGSTVCFASRRGLALITPSAASLYRIVDKFKPTLFLDEFNSDVNSDDAAAIIQILNAGFQQTAQIPRQVATSDGQYKTEMFDAFCPKIIGSLKQSASNAFNSRCIEIQMERTTRNDIPLRLSRKHLQDAQDLRNKLTLWRMRNIQVDFEAKLDQAENELRQCGIMPRSIQINIPLFALINDDDLKQDFISLLQGRDAVLHEEKRNSIDGEIIQMLYNILFDIQEDGTAEWKINQPKENELCEDLRIEKIVLMLNDARKESEKLNARYVGKKLSSFGLRAAQILSRKSDYHKKSAIHFDSHRLKVIFSNYGLPIPADFSLDHLDQNNNTNEDKDLSWSNEDLINKNKTIHLDQSNPNQSNNNNEWSKWSKEISEKDGQSQNSGFSDQSKGEIFEI